MAGNIKGITIEIGGDTGPLDKALSGVNKTARDLQSELREVERGLKLDPGNVVLLEQKQKLLADSVANTSTKLGTLKEAEKQAQTQFANGKISEEQYRALQREVIKTEQQLQSLESQATKSNAVLSKDDAAKNLQNIALAAGAAAVAVGGALVGAAVSAGQKADDINTLAKVTGLSTAEIQKFQYASDRIDVSVETLTGSLSKLTKNMASAKDGGAAATEAFEALGVSVVDGNGDLRDNNEVFAESIDALGKMTNETERDALAMKIFGKSAQQLNPLILGGADALKTMGEEAEAAGIILDQQTLDKANQFNDSLDALKALSAGLFGSIGADIAANLVPMMASLVELLQGLPSWLEENRTGLTLVGVAVGVLTALVVAFNVQQLLLASGMTLWGAVAGIATTVTTGLGVAFAFLTSPIGLVILAIGAIIAIGVLLYQHWDEVKAKALELWQSLTERFEIIRQSISDSVKKMIDYVRVNWINIIQFFINPIGSVIKLLYNLNPQFRAWVDSAFQTIKDTLGRWKEIGTGMIDGIMSGVSDAASRLADTVVKAAKDALDSAKDFLGIQSPSKVFREQIGAQIGAGMALGIDDSMDEVNDAIAGISTDISLGVSTDKTRNAGAAPNQITVNVHDGVNGLKRELGRWGVRMP